MSMKRNRGSSGRQTDWKILVAEPGGAWHGDARTAPDRDWELLFQRLSLSLQRAIPGVFNPRPSQHRRQQGQHDQQCAEAETHGSMPEASGPADAGPYLASIARSAAE